VMGEALQGKESRYRFRLFVAGEETKSRDARTNLSKICERLSGACEVEVVDVLENFRAALEDRVLITPTLLMVSPPPPVRVVGTLKDTAMVASALRLHDT
jgi:circadian clock protein KaiB